LVGAGLAQEVGRSVSWVKKWRRRLAAAAPDDEAVLRSRSRARLRPPPTMSGLAVERVLAIRDDPPAAGDATTEIRRPGHDRADRCRYRSARERRTVMLPPPR
jgi:hypothetical protein